MIRINIINGRTVALLCRTLKADSFDCIVTSPPYWGLRDYGVDGQIGLEPISDSYVETMAALGDERLWRAGLSRKRHVLAGLGRLLFHRCCGLAEVASANGR